MTGQGDITMRQYATELLHRLLETTSWEGGPGPRRAQEIVAATLSGLSPDFAPLPKPDMTFQSENLLYNTLVAIGFTECNIGAPYRPQVVAALAGRGGQLGGAPRTKDKLHEVLASLKRCS